MWVVAWALDRLCRNARDRLALIEACRDAGVMIALVSASDMDPTTPAGRWALGILGEVAQHEIDQKSDRRGARLTTAGGGMPPATERTSWRRRQARARSTAARSRPDSPDRDVT
jgi:hypothetical protein